MSKTMKALVLRGGKAAIERRPIPRAGPGEVVVRTTAASLCSADAACVSGEFPTPDGTVLGHEAVGVVHEIGSLVSGFSVGRRVTAASTTPCGQCANCQRGFSGHCGGSAWGGYTFGVSRDGSLAEYFTVPFAEHNLVPIPDGVTDAAAVCVPDTIASGSTGPEAARFPLGGTVVVFGQGHIGLAATMAARALGVGLVVTVKARPGGEALAQTVGADRALNLAEHDVETEIRQLTAGAGADCAVEASGVAESFARAVAVTRLGGVITVLSSYSGPDDASLSIPLARWGWGIGDKTILSTFQRSGSERLGRLLRLVETGRLDPTPLVTRRYVFDDSERALADLAAREPGHIKPLITF
ncbi:alcohol dehydrogenase catalytic domain-containing protein [Streptomyces malaysiensis]|uniref:alcohol dehydrogenase catalytic domain-containing protein n=1 Tax=Streptomyces malaysiensis TaxID=92644 RepID=UPI002B2EF42D|nr:alcohol dehydrogenase catalytic domain-containing protein [Streptomyces malaysiensis]